MGMYNGTFNYTTVQDSERDPETGFISASGTSDWIPGGECQIEKAIPARRMVGADGQTYAYTYDVFIPRHFTGELAIGDKIQLISENGVTDEFTIQGIDDMNRKYIEIWG